MICNPDFAVEQINKMSEDLYGLRMVLMSIANTHPDVVLQAIYKINGETDEFMKGLRETFERGGRVAAAKYYMEHTGAPILHVIKCLDRIFKRA